MTLVTCGRSAQFDMIRDTDCGIVLLLTLYNWTYWCFQNRSAEWRHLRRKSRRDGGGEGYRNVLHVRAPPGAVRRKGLHRLPAQRQSPRPLQTCQVLNNSSIFRLVLVSVLRFRSDASIFTRHCETWFTLLTFRLFFLSRVISSFPYFSSQSSFPFRIFTSSPDSVLMQLKWVKLWDLINILG